MLNAITMDRSNALKCSKFKYHELFTNTLNNPKAPAKLIDQS